MLASPSTGEPAAEALSQLVRAPGRHRAIVGALLIAPLRVAAGSLVDAARDAATSIGLVEGWLADLQAHAWWRRSEAARALGLLEVASAVRALMDRLNDEHEEVRAASVEALGRIGDLSAVPALLGALPDASRHQRARVVEALRELGPMVTPALIAHARVKPGDLAMVAQIVGFTGAAAAVDDLLAWSAHADPRVRKAALQAIGSLGLDDRAYYYTLRALGDDSAEVRAMAARALGRARREDAAAYLSAHLTDEWVVAAHAATALQMLGEAGTRELLAHERDEGLSGVLARQMLWERRVGPAGGGA